MTNFLIAFLVAIGAGTWIYTKMMKSTGGLTKNALVVSGTVAFILFLFLITLMSFLD